MIDPLFWLGLSILLVAVSLTAVLVVAVPAFRELARAARSVEKLADTLRRELPPTLEAIRLTGMEISELTDDVNEGVKSAGQVVKQVDQSISSAGKQAQKVQVTTKSVFAGVKAAWKTFSRPNPPRRSIDRLPPSERGSIELRNNQANPVATTASSGKMYRDPYTEESSISNRKAHHPDANDAFPNQSQYEDYDDLESIDSDE
ncbi:DUF948 domain-containing protein [Microcoleus sp. FACHB-831]|uniref:DUF948 domain-containing protein n=1 Tax=Microcoleus sp. FACHB-831 TaxID=2692827 RepID=UPI0016846579|nr:DUF948 domain-containing protein [Microcoleus sp. FACHB-831]MBD1923162.1 DUF948 domain-containing protein [Microcoleus sp. FACHB-831]